MPLPWELKRRILLDAAYSDVGTAHQLAYVSKEICACTSEARWQTIALTTHASLFALLKLLHDAPSWAIRLSLPSGIPTHATRQLFVDTSEDKSGHDLLTRIEDLTPSERADMVPVSDILKYVPHLDTLCLGSLELQAFSSSIQSVSPVDLTLVFDGNETLFSYVLNGHDAASGQPRRGLRRRLTRLHVVGINPQSDLTGLPMPLTILEPLCAGSWSENSYLNDLLSEQNDLVLGRVSGLRRLRYDTRKFSFRPTDIFATRLRVFFQALDAGPEDRARLAEAWDALGLDGLQRLELCWRSDTGVNSTAPTPAHVQATHSMYTGGWPQERRGAWTDRASAQETFRQELVDSISELYGWHDVAPGMPDGTFVPRLQQGFHNRDHTMLERLEVYFGTLAPPTDTAADTAPSLAKLQFRARRPATFLDVGQQAAALLVTERLALFWQRAYEQRRTGRQGIVLSHSV